MGSIKHSREWIRQAEYDMETAQVMLESGRYIYCIFMTHLSIEKALKALYVKRSAKNPPKTHSLVYLTRKADLILPSSVKEFIESLDGISVPTRYPDELAKLLKEYSKEKTETIFTKSKEVLEWIKKELGK